MTEIVNGSLRMLGDRILLRPLDWKASDIIIAIRHGRPVRGEVVAVGPGKWVKRYVTGKRDGKDFRKSYETKVFQKTELKSGDIVNIGGLNVFDGKGYMALLEVMVGNETMLIFQEADVAVVEERNIVEEAAKGMRIAAQRELHTLRVPSFPMQALENQSHAGR